MAGRGSTARRSARPPTRSSAATSTRRVRDLEGAENELRRLARDIEDVPADPKALAGRLVRRQYALNGEIDEALHDVRNKDKLGAEEKAALNARMKSLARREEAIARLAKTIKPPEGKEGRNKFPQEAAREAVNKTTRAVETLGTLTPQVIEEGKNGARQALERLANELPDIWRRQEPTRQKFDEARRTMNELSGQIAQHLRETEPRPDKPATAAQAAEELARRLNDAADRQAKAVAALEEMEPEPRVEPQRARAVRRASALAEILKDLRDPSKREAARAALPLVEIQARAAMDRLEQKLNGRVPADDLAAELADDQHQIHEGLTHAKGESASSGRGSRESAPARQRAAEPECPRRDARPDRGRPAGRAGRASPDESERKGRPRRRGPRGRRRRGEPGRPPRGSPDAASTGRGPRPRRARPERAGRASPTRRNPRCVRKPSPPSWHACPWATRARPPDGSSVASELADRAAQIDDDRNGAGRPTAAALADARIRAAEALDTLAAQPAKPAPAPKPAKAEPPATADTELALNPGHVATAKELVRRQRQLRERLQAVLGRHVEPQQAIRREAVALGGALSELRDRIRPLSDRGPYPAFEAAHHLRGLCRAVHGPGNRTPGTRPGALRPRRPAPRLRDGGPWCAARRGPGRGTPRRAPGGRRPSR